MARRRGRGTAPGGGAPPRGRARRGGRAGSARRNGALFTSAYPAWRTPPFFLDLVRRLGPIGLDPCASRWQRNHFARVNLTGPRSESPAAGVPGDGLKARWGELLWPGELVFVNPPYGQAVGPWAEKCAAAASSRAPVVLLIASRTDTVYLHASIARKAAAVCFWKGRIRFLGPGDDGRGRPATGATFPSLVAYYGPYRERFLEVFGDRGWVVPGEGLVVPVAERLRA